MVLSLDNLVIAFRLAIRKNAILLGGHSRTTSPLMEHGSASFSLLLSLNRWGIRIVRIIGNPHPHSYLIEQVVKSHLWVIFKFGGL